jgi:predicted transcriptional regulator
MICKTQFRQLSSRHLASHGLTPRAYRARFGIPQPLSARETTRRRREIANTVKPWLLRPYQRDSKMSHLSY